MSQSTDRIVARRRGRFQVVDGGVASAAHQPWCDPAEHAGASCRSTPIRLAFGYRGEQQAAVSSALLQLAAVPAATRGEASGTRARVTLGTDVFEFEVDQLAAMGAGFESLLLAVVGMGREAAVLADKARRMAEAKPYPNAAGV